MTTVYTGHAQPTKTSALQGEVRIAAADAPEGGRREPPKGQGAQAQREHPGSAGAWGQQGARRSMFRAMSARRAFALAVIVVGSCLGPLSLPLGARTWHMRMSHPVLSEVFGRGLQRSPTFRALVAQLEESDVVIQVRLDTDLRIETGFTKFLSSTGGDRFVRIAVHVVEPNDAAVALLAHELQHAVEIADEPSIEDASSYAGFVRAIGFASCDGPAACFETSAALDAGRRVMRELRD